MRTGLLSFTATSAIKTARYFVPWQPYTIALKGSEEPAPAVLMMRRRIANVQLDWIGEPPQLVSAAVVSATGEITEMTLQKSTGAHGATGGSTALLLRRLGALLRMIDRPVSNHTFCELTGETVDAANWSAQMSKLEGELERAGAHLSIVREDCPAKIGPYAFKLSSAFVIYVTPRPTAPFIAYITCGYQAFNDLSYSPPRTVIRVKMGKTSNEGHRQTNRRTDMLEPNPVAVRHFCDTMDLASAVEKRWLALHPELGLAAQFGYKNNAVGTELYAIDADLIREYIAEADKITSCDSAGSSNRRPLTGPIIIAQSDGDESERAERTTVVDRRDANVEPPGKRARPRPESPQKSGRAKITRLSAVNKIDQIGDGRVRKLKGLKIFERAQGLPAALQVSYCLCADMWS